MPNQELTTIHVLKGSKQDLTNPSHNQGADNPSHRALQRRLLINKVQNLLE